MKPTSLFLNHKKNLTECVGKGLATRGSSGEWYREGNHDF